MSFLIDLSDFKYNSIDEQISNLFCWRSFLLMAWLSCKILVSIFMWWVFYVICEKVFIWCFQSGKWKPALLCGSLISWRQFQLHSKSFSLYFLILMFYNFGVWFWNVWNTIPWNSITKKFHQKIQNPNKIFMFL